MSDVTPAIEVRDVRKAFGQDRVQALDGVDLTVTTGTLTALLGPNGAGKTTLVRIIATLARADDGQVRVFGYDTARQAAQVRARIGLTGQYAGLDDALSGRDNLMLIGRLAGLSRGPRETGQPNSPARSGSPTPPNGWCAPTPAACAGASTSPPA